MLKPWKAEGAETKLLAEDIPTVVTPMQVHGAPAVFLVWGCSQSGKLRATKPLTEALVKNLVLVQALLSEPEANNKVIPLYGGTAQIPNRAQIEYNGALFVFGEDICYIVSQIITVSEDGQTTVLAPVYSLAPFRGGCLNQEALCLAWNDLYVGESSGAIYKIVRVIQSGAYTTEELFASTNVLEKDSAFTFKDTYWIDEPTGFGKNTFFPLKKIVIFYDLNNEGLSCCFYWNMQFLPDLTPETNLALFLYKNDCVEQSTGWSFLEIEFNSSFSVHPGAISENRTYGGDEELIYSFVWPKPPAMPTDRTAFANIVKYNYSNSLYTPFFKSAVANTLLEYKTFFLAMDRRGEKPIILSIVCVSDTSSPVMLQRYKVPSSSDLNVSNVGVLKLAGLNTKNMFNVGITGVYFRVILKDDNFLEGMPPVVYPEIPTVGSQNSAYELIGVSLQTKPVGEMGPDASFVNLR